MTNSHLDMLQSHSLARVLSVALPVAVFLGYLVIEVIDRVTASSAMRRRVNAGSDRYFRERGSIVGAAARSTDALLSEIGQRPPIMRLEPPSDERRD